VSRDGAVTLVWLLGFLAYFALAVIGLVQVVRWLA
jgi:hypothetical protein